MLAKQDALVSNHDLSVTPQSIMSNHKRAAGIERPELMQGAQVLRLVSLWTAVRTVFVPPTTAACNRAIIRERFDWEKYSTLNTGVDTKNKARIKTLY